MLLVEQKFDPNLPSSTYRSICIIQYRSICIIYSSVIFFTDLQCPEVKKQQQQKKKKNKNLSTEIESFLMQSLHDTNYNERIILSGKDDQFRQNRR